MKHDPLDDRLRRGLHDLADAAGDVPPWPGSALDVPPGRTTTHPAYGLMVAVVTVAVVIGGLIVVSQRGSDGVAERTDGAPGFFGTRWSLTSVEADGRSIDISNPGIVWVFGEENPCRFDVDACDRGPVLVGEDACNHFERSITVDDQRATWGDWSYSTLAGCGGDLQTALDRIRQGQGFTYDIVDDVLRVNGSGIEMSFVVGHPLGEPSRAVVDEGLVEGVAYRVSWDAGVSIEWVDTSTASMVNALGYAAMPDALSAKFADLGVGQYLFTILPDAAVEAAYVTDGGTRLELQMLDHDAPLVAAGRPFDGDPGPGRVIAFDAAGQEIASISMRGADEPGITSVPSATVPASTAP